MRKHYYVKVKQKKNKHKHEIIGFILIGFGVLLLYGLLWPHYAGSVGLWLNKTLTYIFGLGKLFFPFTVFFAGVIILIRGSETLSVKLFGMVGILWIASTFFSLVTQDSPDKNLGGWIGKYSEKYLVRAFGEPGLFIILIVALFLILHWITRFSIAQFVKTVYEKIYEDWKLWKEAKSEEKKKKREKSVNPPILKPVVEPEVPPRIITSNPLPVENVIKEVKKRKETKSQAPKKEDEIEIPQKPKVTPQIWKLPSLDLLNENSTKDAIHKEEELVSRAAQLESSLSSFNIQAKVTDINPGPIITRYDLKLAPGVKVGSIISLSNDLALSMRSSSIRIVAPIPGKAAVGIEIPNSNTALVGLREILGSETFRSIKSKMALGLGKTTDGGIYCSDLIPMPHLLIAGATGSGKSICIHSIIVSMLYNALPDEVKMVLIDPKRLELPVYNGLPHLYDPSTTDEKVAVITNPKHAAKTLEKLTHVMESRYEKFAKVAVRNIEGYNKVMEKRGEPKEYYIVVIIDELADLMLIALHDVEEYIQRLAQMARAVGIHLILATQRPSVDVITGVIKANLSSRIAFQVLSKVDSRVILDTQGAENLLGRGDMLFLASGEPKPFRLQGAFISEKEVERVVGFFKAQGKPAYESTLVVNNAFSSQFEDEESFKNLIIALQLIQERRRISQDLLKAHFGSSAKATNILSLLEVKKFIRKPEGTNRWEIFFDQVDAFLNEQTSKVKP